MSLPLPNLDNRTYAELLEEALSLIPSEYAKWTNHNPSDPGIILMEMLAWLTEMLLYRVDQVPDSNVEVFLKLLNGPDWQRTGDLDAAIRQTILELRQRYRAASCEDFQQLVLEDWHQTQAAQNLGADGQVARVKCLKERNLAASSPSARAETAPGHVSLVVLPQRPKPAAKTPDSVLSFDGLSSYVDLANGISALIDNQITVEAWAYSNDLLQKSEYRAIASDKYPDGGNKVKFELYLMEEDHKLSGGFYDSSWHSVSSDSGFPMNEWVHVAASYAGESIKLYQNGNLIQESDNLNVPLPTTGSGWRIGGRHDYSNPSDLWKGKITEVRIWNRVCSTDDIQANMNRRLTGNETGLVGYWPLNDGDGSVALDKTANQNHGTLNGAQWVTDSELQLAPPPYLMLQPTTALCQNLWIYLDERRLLTTRHHVVGPDYVIVQITATLHLQAGARPDAVRSQAVTSLKQFFDPLQGGTEGKGWPFGRDVYISEVYERLDSLPGVDYVENITLQGDASQRQVTLEDHQLVALDVDENSFTIN